MLIEIYILKSVMIDKLCSISNILIRIIPICISHISTMFLGIVYLLSPNLQLKIEIFQYKHILCKFVSKSVIIAKVCFISNIFIRIIPICISHVSTMFLGIVLPVVTESAIKFFQFFNINTC